MELMRERFRDHAPRVREPIPADAETAAPRLTRLSAPAEGEPLIQEIHLHPRHGDLTAHRA